MKQESREDFFSTSLELCDLQGVINQIIILLIYLSPQGKPVISHEVWGDFETVLDNKYCLWCKIICSPASRLQIIHNSILTSLENGTS